MKIHIKILNENEEKEETNEKQEKRKQYAKDYYQQYGKFGLKKGRQHKTQEEPIKIKIRKTKENEIKDEKNNADFDWNYIKNIKNKKNFYDILLTVATKEHKKLLDSFSNQRYINIKEQIENEVSLEQKTYLQNSLFKTLDYCAENFSSFFDKLNKEECAIIQDYTSKFDSDKEKKDIDKIIKTKKPTYDKDITINRKLYGGNFNLKRLKFFLDNQQYEKYNDTITSWSVLPINCFEQQSMKDYKNNINRITYPIEILDHKKDFLPEDFFGNKTLDKENYQYLTEDVRKTMEKRDEDTKIFDNFENFEKDVEENGGNCLFSLQTTVKKNTTHGFYIDSNSNFLLEGEYIFQNCKKKNIKIRRDCIKDEDCDDAIFQYTITFDIEEK